MVVFILQELVFSDTHTPPPPVFSLGVVPDKTWRPPVPFYDFLAIMDEEAPGYAAQQRPKAKRVGRKEEDDEETRSAGRETAFKPQTSSHHTEL